MIARCFSNSPRVMISPFTLATISSTTRTLFEGLSAARSTLPAAKAPASQSFEDICSYYGKAEPGVSISFATFIAVRLGWPGRARTRESTGESGIRADPGAGHTAPGHRAGGPSRDDLNPHIILV